MRAINCSFIYDLGINIATLSELKIGLHPLQKLLPAARALRSLIDQDVFHLPLSKAKAQLVFNALSEIPYASGAEDEVNLSQDLIKELDQLRFAFEAVLRSEWSVLAVFAVAPKRGYDTNILVWEGLKLFDPMLKSKVPNAEDDLTSAARCIAFELPTAAVFHIFRGFEAVLLSYREQLTGEKVAQQSDRAMGPLITAIEKSGKATNDVVSSLRDLKNYHRNPLIHPERTIDSIDDAIALLYAVQAPITYMLKAIPESL